MQMNKILGTLAPVLVLALPVAASANPLPAPVDGMKCMAGTWHGTAEVTMGKDRATLKATWTCKPTSQKWGVLCTMHATGMPGLASYDETDLMGYEPNTNTYHWYAVTNAGETHDHVAPATDSDTFRFVYRGKQNGKPFDERIALTIGKDEKTITGRSESFVAGTSVSTMKFTMRK
jgi:hypothetical protein